MSKTTRRSFLGLLAAVPAIAALAPKAAEAAAESLCCGGACPGQGAYAVPVSPVASSPLTPYGEFYAQQAECRARGCTLEELNQPLGWRVLFAHSGFGSPRYQAATLDYETMSQIRLWVARLHRYEAMARADGLALSEIRRMNREALGLPLDRPSTDAEIVRAARIDSRQELPTATWVSKSQMVPGERYWVMEA